ncbi:MAG: tetratricopeptide repeat protein [Planctomycetota bacterium]|nr:tetratricopeptide repeat protein [Planctomycetota bacterium]
MLLILTTFITALSAFSQEADLPTSQPAQPGLKEDMQWEASLLEAEKFIEDGDTGSAERLLLAMLDRATVQSLQAMAALGQLRLSAGDAEGALPLLANAAGSFEALGQGKTRRTAHVISNLAVAFDRLERYEEAEIAARHALDIFVEIHGENHREVAISLNNLAGIVHAQGRRDDELALRRRESAVWQAVAPKEDSMRMQSQSAFAWNLTASGLPLEAKPLYEELIPVQIAVWGKDDIAVADTRINFGWCLQQIGEFEQARTEYEVSLTALEKVLGPDHLGLVEPLRFQATLLLGMNLPDEAAASFSRAAAIVSAFPEEDDSGKKLEELAWLVGGQATALKQAGRTGEAAAVEMRLNQLLAETERRAAGEN